MLTFLAFLAAFAGAVAAYDIANRITAPNYSASSLTVQVGEQQEIAEPARSTWAAILGVVLPRWFNPSQATNRERVAALLRRAGYHPYPSVEAFYLGAMAEFGKGIVEAAALSVVLVLLGLQILVAPIAAAILWLAYRRPYSRLQQAAKRRAELMRPNMLTGLAQLEALLTAGVGVQDALRRTSQLGGPFCNLLGLLVARLEIEEPARALERMEAHIPDPEDTNLRLFIQDLRDYFLRQRPLATSVSALRRSVHAEIVNATASRAAKVKRVTVLFGILAIVGMLLSALAPVF